jgi:hypothetical protein
MVILQEARQIKKEERRAQMDCSDMFVPGSSSGLGSGEFGSKGQ